MPEVQVAPAAQELVTTAARSYALRQLARRAGVSCEWFATWRVEHDRDATFVYPMADSAQRIRFRHAAPEHWDKIRAGAWSVVKLEGDDADGHISELIVPFAERMEPRPLFTRVEEGADCKIDLLASILLTLARYEETLPGPRDRHQRFPLSASLAAKHGFLDRPIVDEFGLAFEQVLRRVFPGWHPSPRQLRVNITHDVDEVGIPFRWRIAARRTRQCGIRTGAGEVLRRGRPRALAAVAETVALSRQRGLGCSVFWKATPAGEFDSGYNIRDPRVLEQVAGIREAGAELGVHPGYETWLAPERLAEEVNSLRQAFGDGEGRSGRQHFLRWSPQSWQDWESCGLRCDSSVGFSEQPGFRAGTCYPYRPWLLAQDREAGLLEVPLVAMDCTLTGALGLRGAQCLEPLLHCLAACANVGGVFTLLWHTDSILDPAYGNSYPEILDKLAGYPSFRWQQDYDDEYV